MFASRKLLHTTMNKERIMKDCQPKAETLSGKVMSGTVVVLVGIGLLLRQMNMGLPEWLFTWPMILISAGFYFGAKHNFSRLGWSIPVLIGSVFLFNEIFPDFTLGEYFWPLFIIAMGLFIIFRPKRLHRHFHMVDSDSTEDLLDSVSIFGGTKKNIVSKNFKGGEIVCVFGGAEVNLSQADINGKVVLELTQVFGGTKLIVPPNWQIQPEMVTLLGGMEDKRTIHKEYIQDDSKILILKGTTVFGGLEIKSF
jgi:predicted membrane protein